MEYNDSQMHHRRSLRLKGYDYAQAGAYFVTICILHRRCLLGEIYADEMQLSETGRIVRDEWLKAPLIRPGVELDAYVVMPNHFHGIVVIAGSVGNACIEEGGAGGARGPRQGSVGALVAGFKSSVTRRVNQNRITSGASLWQRNYYEHVIRDDADYTAIVEYVATNPQRWIEDKLHPDHFWVSP
jgi:putative transposase